MGIIEGSDYIGSVTSFFIRFRTLSFFLSSLASISSLRISVTYPLIETVAYDRVDNEGCIGCKATDIWKASEVGESQKTFCSSSQAGYVSQTCIIGSTGNGMWSGNSISECSEIVAEPKLDNGEGYFRGTIEINIEPWRFSADEHAYMMELLRQQVTGSDLPSKAFTAEAVRNVNSLSEKADSSKPVEVDIRVTGETSKVRKALKSIRSVMDTGALHKKMIIRDQMYFDVTMSFEEDIKITSNNTYSIIVGVSSVVIVILVVVVVILLVVVLKNRPKTKIPRDVESGSEYDSYSDSYDYSDYSSEEEHPSV